MSVYIYICTFVQIILFLEPSIEADNLLILQRIFYKLSRTSLINLRSGSVHVCVNELSVVDTKSARKPFKLRGNLEGRLLVI